MKTNLQILIFATLILLSACRKRAIEEDEEPPKDNMEIEFLDVELGSSGSITVFYGHPDSYPILYKCNRIKVLDLPSTGILNETFSFHSTRSEPNISINGCTTPYADKAFYHFVAMDWTTGIGTLVPNLFEPSWRDSLDAIEASFILSTPTDGDLSLNEKSGIWFQDPSGNQTLKLPKMSGWFYEFEVVVNGNSLSFLPTIYDINDSWPTDYCDTIAPSFNVPGMDFLLPHHYNYSDVTMPITDLSGATIIVWLKTEMYQNQPIYIQLLKTNIPANAPSNTTIEMDILKENFFPKGTVKVKSI